MLPVGGPAEEAKCEDLEKFAIGGVPEKFFSGWGLAITSGEERAGRVS